MTWGRVNFVLQWGPAGAAAAAPAAGTPATGLTVYLPGGAPAWAAAKSARLLRGWLRPAGGVRGFRSPGRWVTFAATARPARWAHRGSLRRGQLDCTTRAARRLARTAEFDYTRWTTPVRGVTHLARPWGCALRGERHLARPRYV